MVNVAAEIVLVLVRSVNETPLSSTVPPLAPAPNPKYGSGGTSASLVPLPPICHRVTVDSSAEQSRSFTLAARPPTSTVSPLRFGTVNCTGLLFASAPNCHPVSATTKKLVASGTTVHAGDTVSVVPVLDGGAGRE